MKDLIDKWGFIIYNRFCWWAISKYRSVAQFGRALRSGRRGRVFESRRLDWTKLNMACWSSGQDDALSRRKPGFDSRTGHEAVWNFHTAFFCSVLHSSTILSPHCPCFAPEPPCLLFNFVRRFLFSPHVFPHTISPNFISRFLYKKIFTNNSWFLPSFCCNMCYNNNRWVMVRLSWLYLCKGTQPGIFLWSARLLSQALILRLLSPIAEGERISNWNCRRT